MDVIGAQADDEEQDFIRRVCEQELLSSDNLLGLFAPLIKDICSSPLQYPDPQVITYKDYVSLIIYINTTHYYVLNGVLSLKIETFITIIKGDT